MHKVAGEILPLTIRSMRQGSGVKVLNSDKKLILVSMAFNQVNGMG